MPQCGMVRVISRKLRKSQDPFDTGLATKTVLNASGHSIDQLTSSKIPSRSSLWRGLQPARHGALQPGQIKALTDILSVPTTYPLLTTRIAELGYPLTRPTSSMSPHCLCDVHTWLELRWVEELMAVLGEELGPSLQKLRDAPKELRSHATGVYLKRVNPYIHLFEDPTRTPIGQCKACKLSSFFQDNKAVKALAICAKGRKKHGRDWPEVLIWLDPEPGPGWELQWCKTGKEVIRDRARVQRWSRESSGESKSEASTEYSVGEENDSYQSLGDKELAELDREIIQEESVAEEGEPEHIAEGPMASRQSHRTRPSIIVDTSHLSLAPGHEDAGNPKEIRMHRNYTGVLDASTRESATRLLQSLRNNETRPSFIEDSPVSATSPRDQEIDRNNIDSRRYTTLDDLRREAEEDEIERRQRDGSNPWIGDYGSVMEDYTSKGHQEVGSKRPTKDNLPATVQPTPDLVRPTRTFSRNARNVNQTRSRRVDSWTSNVTQSVADHRRSSIYRSVSRIPAILEHDMDYWSQSGRQANSLAAEYGMAILMGPQFSTSTFQLVH